MQTKTRIALVLGLLAVGYIAGLATPSVRAYTTNQDKISNQIVSELRSIARSLERIERDID